MDTSYLEYNSLANVMDYASCLTYIVFGCSDANACDYDILVTNDDGSCTYATNIL